MTVARIHCAINHQINNMAQTLAVERTLALIKPDAVEKVEDIIDAVRNAGFTILQVNKASTFWSKFKWFIRKCVHGYSPC